MSPSELHHFTRWEHEPTSLSLGCKRLRPLVPKLIAVPSFDLKSFIRPESGPVTLVSSDYHKKESHQVEAQSAAGGTRWNPTQEQIGILEMLYKSGMRTPNAPQIEQITVQLAKYGKIEGKNVFYWFQNHKARERQKQKRNLRTPTSPLTTSLQLSPASGVEEELSDSSPYKRKRKSWAFDQQCVEVNKECRSNEEEEVENRTLKLFPLHPEGRSKLVN